MKKLGFGLALVLIVALMLSGVVQAQDESPLPTVPVEPTATSAPPDPGDEGGGTVELPEITFDLTVMAVIVGLVEFMKQLGITGKGSLGLSMGLGVALGGSAWLASQGTPGNFAGWFAAVIVGLAYGLAASGLYDLGKKFGASR